MLEQNTRATKLKLLVDPRGRALTYTMTRAELAAIQAALTTSPPAHNIHILTDSLASIYMISNKIYKPSKQFGHCSKDILQDIVDLIRIRGTEGGKTTIGKIKAHIGYIGNEMADQAAKAATLGLEDINFVCPTNSDPMQGLIWPGPHSSVVRVAGWFAGGREFDSPWGHPTWFPGGRSWHPSRGWGSR